MSPQTNILQEVYTYSNGTRISLHKLEDQFIPRALPDELADIGITSNIELVSPHSSRVTCSPEELETLMSTSREVAPTHHAYQEVETGDAFLITDRIFVTFREPLSAEAVGEFAGRYSLLVKQKYSDSEYLFQLTDYTGINPVKLVVRLNEGDELVQWAEHDCNYIVKTCQLAIPSDSDYLRQWHLHTRFRHSEFDKRASARCEEAWQLLNNFGSSDVVIGVTDDGCKLDHPDFNSPNKFADWGYFEGGNLITRRDISASKDKIFDITSTQATHGTSCAGVAAAEVDSNLTVGAAPGCRLLPIKWESTGPGTMSISDSKIETMLDYVADKVDVLSNSWGRAGTGFLRSRIVRNKIETLAKTGGKRGRGIVFVWAAGNENCPIQLNTTQEIPFTDGWNILGKWVGVRTSKTFRHDLVGIAGVLLVGAISSTAQRSHYSNYGTGLSICAPSNNRHLYNRLTVKGLGIVTTTGPDSISRTRGLNPMTKDSFGGTSSATPLVAGIAALVISANPKLTALEVVSILKQTASKDLDMTGYPKTPPASGYDPNPTWDISPIDKGDFLDKGLPDGTWSPWFGHGRVDAFAAVKKAL